LIDHTVSDEQLACNMCQLGDVGHGAVVEETLYNLILIIHVRLVPVLGIGKFATVQLASSGDVGHDYTRSCGIIMYSDI
jgi:hypothetical protein